MTLVCLSGCFVSDLFHKVGICVNISLNHSNNLWEIASKVKLGKLKSVQILNNFDILNVLRSPFYTLTLDLNWVYENN